MKRNICQSHLKGLLLSTAVALPALAQLTPAAAQVAAEQDNAQASQAQEVVVTGSRIARDGYQAPTPVTVLDKDALNGMGQVNIADAVNLLPQLAQSVNPVDQPAGYGGGTIGVNELNLRALGTNRTLVLQDGKRMINASLNATFAAPDVNTVPNALVSRVDVVTGGASAAYGSDALSGVVNFVFDHDFTGVKGEIEGGLSTYGDDDQYKASLTVGTTFGDSRGHFIVSGEYTRDLGIHGNTRPWNANSAAIMVNPNWTKTNGQPNYLVTRQVGLSNGTPGGLVTSGPLKGVYFGPGGTPQTFQYGLVSPANNVMSGGSWQYSRIDQNASIDPALLRGNLYSRTSYFVTDNLEVYGELQWSHTNASNTAIPNRTLGSGATIQAGNSFIPASIAAQMSALNLSSFTVGSTNGDLGIVKAADQADLTRQAVGAEGDFTLLGTKWKWDAYLQHSQYNDFAAAYNDINKANYALATNAVINPATGAIVCRSTLANPNNGCVPYNAMGTGVNSQAAINYVLGTSSIAQTMFQNVIAGNISGEPISTWAGPVSMAIGIEHRREAAHGQSTALDQANAFGLGDYHPTDGSYNATEEYFETVIPLAKAWSWAEALNLNGAVRQTDYTTSGSVLTWKVGGDYQPIDDVRFRSVRSRDIRAPYLGELYSQGQTSPGTPLFDPFTNKQLPAVIGEASGNPNLKPEVADTTEIGAVFSPTFLPGFQASADYYSININNAVGTPAQQSVVNLCYQGYSALCSAIQRTNGQISLVVTQPENIAWTRTDGLDLEASYRLPLSKIWQGTDGIITLRGLGTYVRSMKSFDPTTGIITQGAGVLGGRTGAYASPVNTGPSAPTWQSTAFINYDTDLASAQLMMRYVGSGVYNQSFTSCSSGCPTGDQRTISDNNIGSNTVFGASVTYRPFENKNTDIYFVADNIFNNSPPVIAGNTSNAYYLGQSNTDYYDRIGRMFRFGMRFKL